MTDQLAILVVDDDSDLVAMHAAYLRHQGYEVLTATNGQEGLALVAREPSRIGVIVSDVMMPVMGGYDFCRALKEDVDTGVIPLLFVSQLTDLNEKIKGYGVGADDYIGKPVAPEELGLKVHMLLELRNKNIALRQEISESRQVAMQAMSYSSDLGQVLEFYKNTLVAKDFEQISQQLFEFTSGHGLRTTLQIISRDGLINFGDQGAVSPLESSVIELSRVKGRFFDFGARTIINYQDFSILIKNMPLEDQVRYGILKDTIGTLCNAIESRVRFLLYENAAEQKKRIVSAVVNLMEDIDKSFAGIQQANLEVVNQMMDELDEAMMDLGLTNQQEDLIRTMAGRSRDRMNDVFKRSAEMYIKFDHVREQLDEILTGEG
ncbi:MAG: response regulator [Gammaproteobacteria bacterium]|nr:response regulator [Gammaproteobacteria bacterium]